MNHEFPASPAPANLEPVSDRSTVPMWIVTLTLILLFLGFVYFDRVSGWFDPNVYGPYVSSEQLDAYQPRSGAAAMFAQGRMNYDKVCGICHGPDGMGKPGTSPPLAGSEWVNAKGVQRLVTIPLAGLTGHIQVKGADWSLSMAPMGAALSDADLAAVLTYIRGSWGNKGEPVSAEDVTQIRKKVSAHPGAMTGDEMMKMPE